MFKVSGAEGGASFISRLNELKRVVKCGKIDVLRDVAI